MPRGMTNTPVFSPPKRMGSPMQMPMMPPLPGGMPPMPASPQGLPQAQHQRSPSPGFAAPGFGGPQAGFPAGQPTAGQPDFPLNQPGFPGAFGQIPYMNPYAAQKAASNPALQAAAMQALQAAASQALAQAIQSGQVPPEVSHRVASVLPASIPQTPIPQAPTPIAGRSSNRTFSTLGAGIQYSTRS